MPELSPIDDVRGSAGYRLAAARELLARTIQAAIGPRTRQQAA
jgi:CO/xanthine dehydrogenase FAD-binding subunit